MDHALLNNKNKSLVYTLLILAILSMTCGVSCQPSSGLPPSGPTPFDPLPPLGHAHQHHHANHNNISPAHSDDVIINGDPDRSTGSDAAAGSGSHSHSDDVIIDDSGSSGTTNPGHFALTMFPFLQVGFTPAEDEDEDEEKKKGDNPPNTPGTSSSTLEEADTDGILQSGSGSG